MEIGIKKLSNRKKVLHFWNMELSWKVIKKKNCIEVVAMKHPTQQSRVFNELAFYISRTFFVKRPPPVSRQ